ncbi:MAG TPA: hypothetical protein VNN80_28220, partial [Polyangiaceae bacterium]|nr:hypothetical protein [Polyangiaceae bacterium]
RRSRFVPVCASVALILGALAACLNPMPDDFPNDRGNSEPVAGQAGSTGLSGEDDGQVPIGQGGSGSPETPFPDQGAAGATSSSGAGASGAGGASNPECSPDAGPDAGAEAGCATETSP